MQAIILAAVLVAGCLASPPDEAPNPCEFDYDALIDEQLSTIDAGMAIVLWIGVVISAQAFQTTRRAHAPAVVIGLLPGVGAWGALMAKNGLRAAGVGTRTIPRIAHRP